MYFLLLEAREETVRVKMCVYWALILGRIVQISFEQRGNKKNIDLDKM